MYEGIHWRLHGRWHDGLHRRLHRKRHGQLTLVVRPVSRAKSLGFLVLESTTHREHQNTHEKTCHLSHCGNECEVQLKSGRFYRIRYDWYNIIVVLSALRMN